jgi:hypothetical protein
LVRLDCQRLLEERLKGSSIGRAFLDCKVHFAWWLVKENAPSAADEKTLIGFVLLGDPSIHPLGTKVRHHEIPLAAEERRQRRVARELLADEIRKLIPKRKSATPTEQAKAKTVFANARRSLTASDIKELSKFGVKTDGVPSRKTQYAIECPKKGPRWIAGNPKTKVSGILLEWPAR